MQRENPIFDIHKWLLLFLFFVGGGYCWSFLVSKVKLVKFVRLDYLV